jgi:1-phosphofructokinase family hexose kinase
MSILIVALNPSIDVEWRVKDVAWEEKNQVLMERRWAGGKGVNVARWLKYLGCRSRLFLPLGGPNGAELQGELVAKKFSHITVSVSGWTRANVIVTTEAGRQMRFNPLGPKLQAAEWTQIFARCSDELALASCVILSGSLPREAPANVYARLVRSARTARSKALLDCDGPAFAAAVKAKPFLVKPNEHELSQWAGREFRSEPELISAASELSTVTGGWVLISRGAAGAVLLNKTVNAGFTVRVPQVRPLNTVGAGDAMVAAVGKQLVAGAPPEEWLRWGAATATAVTQEIAGRLPALASVKSIAAQLKVERLT